MSGGTDCDAYKQPRWACLACPGPDNNRAVELHSFHGDRVSRVVTITEFVYCRSDRSLSCCCLLVLRNRCEPRPGRRRRHPRHAGTGRPCEPGHHHALHQGGRGAAVPVGRGVFYAALDGAEGAGGMPTATASRAAPSSASHAFSADPADEALMLAVHVTLCAPAQDPS